MRFSNEQRCFVIKHYYSNNFSYARVRNEFTDKWPEINLSDMQIKRIIDRFEQYHRVDDLPKSGRPRIRTAQFQERVTTQLVAMPITSSRRLAQSVSASHTTTYRAIDLLNNMDWN